MKESAHVRRSPILWGIVVALIGLNSGCEESAPTSPPPKKAAATGAEKAEKAPKAAPSRPAVPLKTFPEKVWVLGFDGVDPDWLQEWADAGHLPNLKKLMDEGSFHRLRSTNPPQSPVAWASFATGLGPGGHGIFDFLKRDPRTYFPAIGYLDIKNPTFGPDGRLKKAPSAVNLRSGVSFWKRAADQGVGVVAINVPYSFPPEVLPNGKTLSGLGTPDLRGTNSTFTFFSESATDADVKKGAAGGRIVKLRKADGRLEGLLAGPKSPGGRAELSVSFLIGEEQDKVEISIGDQKHTVGKNEWSEWFDYSFNVAPSYTVRGIGRFFVESIRPLEVYMYPPNMHPADPWIAFGDPGDYTAALQKRYGYFKTVGWTHDTSALNAEVIDDRAWLDDMNASMDKLTELGLGELDREHPSLFLWVSTATDRVAHMFTRVTDKKSPRYEKGLKARLGGDPILATYERMDKVVGEFSKRLTDDTLLLIVSDHGFHHYDRGLNTNTWLYRNGYLTLKPGKKPGEHTDILTSVDWSRTKAYALGTGQIYINLAGREGKGIVSSADYDALVREIARKLRELEDPKTSTKPLVNVYLGREIFTGMRSREAPDLQLAFAEGWRTSWETMLGGIPEALFADNMKKWSGDHAASDVAQTSGILISNRKLSVDDPDIIDIAPTVLRRFGVKAPRNLKGRDLFEEASR